MAWKPNNHGKWKKPVGEWEAEGLPKKRPSPQERNTFSTEEVPEKAILVSVCSSGTTMEFFFYVTKSDDFVVDLTELGYSASETVPVYDIWGKESLGTVNGSISTKVASHGARLFRLGDAIATGIERTQTPGEANDVSRKSGRDVSFDLSGRMVDTRSLHQPAIVVKNGKKMVVHY
jgi:hypothetical protein